MSNHRRRRNKIRIGFDLDGVIIDKPPFIPKKIIDMLIRDRKKQTLSYRYPETKFERQIRWLSHHPIFRPPIKRNIQFLIDISQERRFELFIISSRYNFLKERTDEWLKKHQLNNHFKQVLINTRNEQPYKFKERIINELKVDIFIDDDKEITKHLVKNTNAVIYWISQKERNKRSHQNNQENAKKKKDIYSTIQRQLNVIQIR